MPQTKNISAKKNTKHTEPEPAEESNGPAILPVGKIKSALEVDIPDDVIGVIEEKVEVDPLLAEEETDEAAEDSLDDDEVNPFGDKWEV